MSIYNQLLNLFLFIVTGITIGILFDIFRIIRRSFKTPDFITYIEDIIFWILTGFILLFTIFTFNDGEIRIYIFIGLILGLIVYLLTLSKYFIKVSVSIICFIKKIIYYPIHVIYTFIRKFIFRPFLFVFDSISKKISKVVKKLPQKTKTDNLSNIYNKIDK